MVFIDWKQWLDFIFIYVNMCKFCKISAIVNLGWSAKYKRWSIFTSTFSITLHSKQLCNLISFHFNSFIHSNSFFLPLTNNRANIKIVLGIIDLSGQSYVIITHLVYKQHKHFKNLSNLLYIPTLLYTKVFAIPLTAKGL